jgi:diguanylate cyclase (GGDEF)-like protein
MTVGRFVARRKGPISWVVLCVAVVAVAGVALANAVDSRRAAGRTESVRHSYELVRSGAADEVARLDRLRSHPGSVSARKALRAATTTQARLFRSAEEHAPAGELPLLRKLKRQHAVALVASSHADFGAARTLFQGVALGAATAQRGLVAADARPWPSTPLQWLGLADLAIVLLVGALTLARLALRAAGLRRLEPSRQSEIERLIYAARSDSLTGLGNHRAFQDDLSSAIEQRNRAGAPFSLLAIDLDGLKLVNDAEGHQKGDAYIKAAAECIEETIEGRGTVYRMGGDEFMAILPDCRNWQALTTAQRIQRVSTDRAGRRTLSIGVTESTNTEGSRVLLHQADLALYEAKRGKLLAVTYHDGLEPQQADRAASGPTDEQKALAATLAQVVDSKDAGMPDHSQIVAELCVAVGTRMGVAGARLERLRVAGLLHDVGKIGVPEALLAKPGMLAPSERSEVEVHVTVGHSILISAGLQKEAEWVLHHHERFDGAGYPSGLAGDAIPLESRILSVADAFEAMTGTRPYRDAMTPGDALAELAAHSGTQFDARCIQALNDVFGGDDLRIGVHPDDGTPAAILIA